jgi:hypothetical protein
MRITNQKDFYSGVLFIVIGLFFYGFGLQYQLGSAAKMGPAYFPITISCILMLLGACTALKALSSKQSPEKVARFEWFEIVMLLAPVALFGFLLKPMGLVIALLALVCISSYASHEFRWKTTLVNAGALVVLCLVIFVYALDLHFDLWPAFLAK